MPLDTRDIRGKRYNRLRLTEITFGNTVSTWVLIGFAATFAVAFLLTAKSWREARRSPYYFQRRQALQAMQSYSLVTLGLMMATAAVVAYAWSPAVSSAPRTALLTNAKPVSLTAFSTAVTNGADTVQRITRQALPSLPAEFSTLEPSSELADATELDNIIFASGINDSYEPVGARSVFGEGEFTLFATFDYSEMNDGMTWAWVWRKDGNVVSGGEQEWAYGDEGPGYVYLEPEEGFAEGEYSLELYVNGELQSASDIEVSAGVANR